MDAIKLIRADHRRMKALFTELENLTFRTEQAKARLIEALVADLAVHELVEEPAFMAASHASEDVIDSSIEALGLLREERHHTRTFLGELASIDIQAAQSRAAIAQVILSELAAHAAIEEGVLYPALRAVVPSELVVAEAEEAHNLAEQLMAELEMLDPASERFTAKLNMLCKLVSAHIREEEQGLLREAGRMLTSEALAELGERMEAVREGQAVSNGIVSITWIDEAVESEQEQEQS